MIPVRVGTRGPAGIDTAIWTALSRSVEPCPSDDPTRIGRRPNPLGPPFPTPDTVSGWPAAPGTRDLGMVRSSLPGCCDTSVSPGSAPSPATDELGSPTAEAGTPISCSGTSQHPRERVKSRPSSLFISLTTAEGRRFSAECSGTSLRPRVREVPRAR